MESPYKAIKGRVLYKLDMHCSRPEQILFTGFRDLF